MPVYTSGIDELRKKPSIDQRAVLIDLLCVNHGSCYRHIQKYRNL